MYNLLDIANTAFWCLINSITIVVNEGLDYITDLESKVWVNTFAKDKKFWRYMARKIRSKSI